MYIIVYNFALSTEPMNICKNLLTYICCQIKHSHVGIVSLAATVDWAYKLGVVFTRLAVYT